MPTIQTEEQKPTYLINEAIRKYRERNPKRSKEHALGVLVSKICFETPAEVYEVASSALRRRLPSLRNLLTYKTGFHISLLKKQSTYLRGKTNDQRLFQRHSRD